jgi:dTDP-4-amino-4,6-dideoxygalactose transaminase
MPSPAPAVSGLAILGAPAAFETPRHVGAPNLPDRELLLARLGEALDRRYLTNEGPLVQEFERRVAARLGVRHCITTANATTGMMVVARALGLEGEVVMPSFTFVATASAMRWLGLRPVFADVDPATHTLDAARAEEAITQRTSAILGVHVWGRPCDVEALQEIAHRRGIALFFDAAPAFDCSHRGIKIGRFGVAEVVSFHATKVLNTFEGGAILTDDDELAERARRMTRFGFQDVDLVVDLGLNAKLSEAAGAMGLAQLERLDEVIALNHVHHERYAAGLAELPGLTLTGHPEPVGANGHYVVLEVDGSEGPLDRDVLLRVLEADNVLARRYFHPGCHRMAPYAIEQPSAGERLPATAGLTGRVLQLPTGTAMTAADVDTVCGIVRRAYEHAGAVRAAAAADGR